MKQRFSPSNIIQLPSRGKTLQAVAALALAAALVAPAAALAQKKSPKTKSCPEGMVAFPAGPFLMGCNAKVDKECEETEQAMRKVRIERAYCLDKTEVTVEAYRKCVEAGKCQKPGTGAHCNSDKKHNHPRNCVSWVDAQSYCASVKKRLPTEAEWERAARGTDGRKYVWGNKPAPTCDWAVFNDEAGGKENPGCGKVSTWPVCSKPKGNTPEGVCDMLGNVWEWVEDKYDPDEPARVVRGGSWHNRARWLRVSHRGHSALVAQPYPPGIRCAMFK